MGADKNRTGTRNKGYGKGNAMKPCLRPPPPPPPPRTGKEYDAALIWTEDVTKDSFKACLREMQNFDGKHEDIDVVCSQGTINLLSKMAMALSK